MRWISQWRNEIKCEGMPNDVLRRMAMLRRQLLIHAYIYYVLNENIISDHEWDRRGREHKALQDEHGWNINFYDDIFKHYNGQSAYWFPTNRKGADEHVARIAAAMLRNSEKIRSYPDAVKTEFGWTSAQWSKEILDKAEAEKNKA